MTFEVCLLITKSIAVQIIIDICLKVWSVTILREEPRHLIMKS